MSLHSRSESHLQPDAVVEQPQEPQMPQSGDLLILTDGRRFQIVASNRTSRGTWFKAAAQDGSCRLEGNLPLRWDPVTRAWRAHQTADQPALQAVPPSMQKPGQHKLKQID